MSKMAMSKAAACWVVWALLTNVAQATPGEEVSQTIPPITGDFCGGTVTTGDGLDRVTTAPDRSDGDVDRTSSNGSGGRGLDDGGGSSGSHRSFSAP